MSSDFLTPRRASRLFAVTVDNSDTANESNDSEKVRRKKTLKPSPENIAKIMKFEKQLIKQQLSDSTAVKRIHSGNRILPCENQET